MHARPYNSLIISAAQHGEEKKRVLKKINKSGFFFFFTILAPRGFDLGGTWAHTAVAVTQNFFTAERKYGENKKKKENKKKETKNA